MKKIKFLTLLLLWTIPHAYSAGICSQQYNEEDNSYLNMPFGSCTTEKHKIQLIDKLISKSPNAANYYWKGRFLGETDKVLADLYPYGSLFLNSEMVWTIDSSKFDSSEGLSFTALNYFIMSVGAPATSLYEKEKASQSLDVIIDFFDKESPSSVIVANKLLDVSIIKPVLGAELLWYLELNTEMFLDYPKSTVDKYVQLVNKHSHIDHQRYVQSILQAKIIGIIGSLSAEVTSDAEKQKASQSLDLVIEFFEETKPSNDMVATKLLDISIMKPVLEPKLLRFYELNAEMFLDYPKSTVDKYVQLVNKHSHISHQLYVKAMLLQGDTKEIKGVHESYRLLLLASVKGSLKAGANADSLKAQLSSDQVEAAKCLVKKGVNPTWIDRKLCYW